jgi:hypothetical protein
MSKRSRVSDPELPGAKRARVEREEGEERLALCLLDLLSTSGLGDVFYSSLDAMSQRAICCSGVEYWMTLKDQRGPLPWPVPSYPHDVDNVGFRQY